MNQGRFRVFCFMLADAFTLAFSWFTVVNGYKMLGGAQYHASAYLKCWTVILAFLGVNWIGRLYQGRGAYPSMPLGKVEEFRRLTVSAVLTHLVVMSVLGFLHQGQAISRFVLIVAGLMTAVLAQPMRNFVRWGLHRLNLGQIPVFVIGEGRAAEIVKRQFVNDPYYGFNIVRFFVRNGLESLMEEAQRYDIKHVFCCFKDDRYFKCLLPQLSGWFSYIEYLPTSASFPISAAQPVSIGTLGGLEMVNQRRMKLLRLEKSILDRLLSIVIFVLSSPCFVIVPILIKLTSRGPVFYKAKRLGKRGQTISVYKFRSMYADADRRLDTLLASNPALKVEYEHNFKLKNDPRVTPLGRLLRKTSIDELPQLINVLRGEMALVGPRPIVEQEIAYYGKSYEIFSSVKPGITGLWQASGRSDRSYDERVALDVYYILNWSPWMDLWIAFRTVVAVLKMKGSY